MTAVSSANCVWDGGMAGGVPNHREFQRNTAEREHNPQEQSQLTSSVQTPIIIQTSQRYPDGSAPPCSIIISLPIRRQQPGPCGTWRWRALPLRHLRAPQPRRNPKVENSGRSPLPQRVEHRKRILLRRRTGCGWQRRLLHSWWGAVSARLLLLRLVLLVLTNSCSGFQNGKGNH